jgi:hypothetical protein
MQPMNAAAPSAAARPDRARRLLLAVTLALVAADLLLGLAGGLVRLGLALPVDAAAALHGLLLVEAVFGTLVALRWGWQAGHAAALLAPLLAGVAGLLAAFGVAVDVPLAAWLVAGLATLAAQLVVGVRRRWPPGVALAVLASLAWCLGTLLWLQGRLAHTALVPWLCFVVLAFVAERHAAATSPASGAARAGFAAGVALLPLACIAALLPESTASWAGGASAELPTLLFWLGAALLAATALPQDRLRLRDAAPGWGTTVAHGLLIGDAWLLAAALLAALQRGLLLGAPGPAWHALFVGFGVSSALGLVAAHRSDADRDAAQLRIALWLLGACLALRILSAGFRHPVALTTSGVALAAVIAWIAVLALRQAWPRSR